MPLALILVLLFGVTFIVLTSPNRISDWFWAKVFSWFKH